MKKLLLFVFALLLIVPVYGLEGNSNYSRKYKYYKLNKVLGPIVTKDEVSDEFPLLDEDNPLSTDVSALLLDKPEEKEGRKIFEYDGFQYSKLPKIDNVVIKVYETSIIYDVSMEDKNGKIEYESNNENNVLTNVTIHYNLKDAVSLKDLILKFKTGDHQESNSFLLTFKNKEKIISETMVMTYSKNFTFVGTQGKIKNDAYEDIYSLNKLNDDELTYQGEVKLYQYQDYQYQSYKLEREYYDEYLKEGFGDYIYRDNDDFLDVLLPNEEVATKEVNNLIPLKSNSKKQVKSNNVYLKPTFKSNETGPNNSLTNFKLPNYNHILKTGNNQNISKQQSSKLYDYFKIGILCVLLLITLKIKNKIKEYR